MSFGTYLTPHEVNVEDIGLNLGLILVERARLRAFYDLPVDIEVGIMAWAYIGGRIRFPVYPAAEMGAFIGERYE
jgi:hypothetical protein